MAFTIALEGHPFAPHTFDKLDLLDYPYDFYFPFSAEITPHEVPEIDLSGFVDLEKKAQDFVLDFKQIYFEEFPTAFNPSIVRWQGSLLMCFRIRHPKTGSTDEIGMVWLDDNFDRKGPLYHLEVPPFLMKIPSKKQDPRMIVIDDRLYMVLNNVIHEEVRRMFVTEVHFDNNRFYTDPVEGLFSFSEEKDQRSEKNWMPFEYNGELLLVYSHSPHRILRPVLGLGSCEEFASSSAKIKWDWGVLRGGTQAYVDGDKYLGFFHSSTNLPTVQSKGKNMPHYVMGAYTFSLEPPFEITHISPEPIFGKGFYTGHPYKTWKPLRVIFPGGFVFDDDYIWVLCGKQDYEMWVVKLDKKRLLESLVPVKPN